MPEILQSRNIGTFKVKCEVCGKPLSIPLGSIEYTCPYCGAVYDVTGKPAIYGMGCGSVTVYAYRPVTLYVDIDYEYHLSESTELEFVATRLPGGVASATVTKSGSGSDTITLEGLFVFPDVGTFDMDILVYAKATGNLLDRNSCIDAIIVQSVEAVNIIAGSIHE